MLRRSWQVSTNTDTNPYLPASCNRVIAMNTPAQRAGSSLHELVVRGLLLPGPYAAGLS